MEQRKPVEADLAAPRTPTQTDPQTQPPEHLRAALDALAREQQGALQDLIREAHRAAELSSALQSPAIRQELHARQQKLAQEIASLLANWQALGGRCELIPPAPVRQLNAPPLTRSAPQHEEPAQAERPGSKPVVDTEPVREPRKLQPTPAQAPQPRAVPRRAPEPEPSSDPPAEGWAEDLGKLLEGCHTSSNTQGEMDVIQAAANASFSRWTRYPRPVQRALVGNMACRLRHLQDHLGVTGTKLDAAFRSLTRFSKSYQPGWVNGLTRGRGPAAESWADEARCWWDQLLLTCERPSAEEDEAPQPAMAESSERQIKEIRQWIQEWREAPDVAKQMCLEKTLEAIQRALASGLPHSDPELCALAGEIYDHLELGSFRRLRQSIRDLEVAEREERQNEEPDAIPPDWAWWSHTVGRQVLFLGGALPSQLHRLESEFGFAAARWYTLHADDSQLERVRSLVGKGSADLVVVAAHKMDRDIGGEIVRICQILGVPWVHMDQGHGITRLRMAIERYLQPDPAIPDS